MDLNHNIFKELFLSVQNWTYIFNIIVSEAVLFPLVENITKEKRNFYFVLISLLLLLLLTQYTSKESFWGWVLQFVRS